MPIDKSWIYIRNRLSNEFANGLRAFIEHAKNYGNSSGHISCPCVKCLNGRMLPVDMVDKHIYRFGFDVTYKRWVFHGETVEETSSRPVPFVSESVDDMAASPHPTIRDASHWERCDRFSSPEFQKVSERNKVNRQKHKFKSFHGRRSYAQHRAKKANTETQVPQPPIDNWKDMHLRDDTWANDLAEETCNMMQQELQAQLGRSDSGSGSASVDQMPIMQRVFGRHRGHILGVGPTLLQSSQQAASGLSSTQRAIYEDRIQRMEVSQQQLTASHQQLTDAVRQLTDIVRQLAPHIRLPSPDAPPSSSSAANDHNNDATNLGD